MLQKLSIACALATFPWTAVATHQPPAIAAGSGGTMDAFIDLDHLEPFLRSFVGSRVTDLTEMDPLVPDPGALAVFGVGLILLGFLRRYVTA